MHPNRRAFLRHVLLAGAWAGAAHARGADRAGVSVPELYERAITGDALVYTEDYRARLDPVTLEAISSSRMTYAFYDVSITPQGRSFLSCLRSVALWNEEIRKNADKVLRADSSSDILRAKEEGKHAMVLLFQDGHPLEGDVERVRLFHDLGVRVLQLTHNGRNMLGDGYTDRSNGGLSDFGSRVVEAMNDVRMLVDLSHCGERTTLDAIRHSKAPCAFTHAGCRSILSTERNKTDAQIRALAEKGGVIGIFNMSCWLTEDDRASVQSLLDHVDHAVRVGGIEHVGFGSDGPMGGVAQLSEELAGHVQFFQTHPARRFYTRRPAHVRVPELNHARRLVVIADALARRGYKEADIEKIIGGNFFRLLRDVVG